jgi:hypothetical protein
VLGGSGTAGVVGVLTIEDIIEELLQTEIIDETDRFVVGTSPFRSADENCVIICCTACGVTTSYYAH